MCIRDRLMAHYQIDNEPSMTLNPVGLDKDKTSQKVGTSSAEAIDFLDVPTFMRKQVD